MSAELRARAARAVAAVLAGRSLDDALPRAERGLADTRDSALVQALAFGVLRDYRLLSALALSMLSKPLTQPEVLALVLVGLFQLRSMRVAEHAAIAETVEAVAELGAEHLRGLVNALLRRYQREHTALEAALGDDPGLIHSHPEWLVVALRSDWPERWQALLAANQNPGPMVLRVNRRRARRENWLADAAVAGLQAEAVAGLDDAVVLDSAVPVERLPGFAAGQVSVQDGSAQWAVELLDVADGQTVLDACAAPGGKTAHILERADVRLLALDSEPARLHKLSETLIRLGLSATVQVQDANRLADRWNGPAFDRILIDAPCSGTGVIRRHPDIKWLRRPDDAERLAVSQAALLDHLWPLLAPGGRLVYATCSTLAVEGEQVVKGFLLAHAEAKALRFEIPQAETRRVGVRLAPGGAFDGFYFAVLQRG